MKIVIPMSGIGKRFIDAGYKDPKPLIEVDGQPIIYHVIDLFPGETEFHFICNEDHLENTNMRDILLKKVPNAHIHSVPVNDRKGPVDAVMRIKDYIHDTDEVIVSYCDYGTVWNYSKFLNEMRSHLADGGIASYIGFHPHMLGSDNYAFMTHSDLWMTDIQEKKPFTNNKMSEYASNGTYYFRSGAIMKAYFKKLIDANLHLNGEFYVSMVYKIMVTEGLRVRIFEIEKMLQWGTPTDLEEYISWSNLFNNLKERPLTFKRIEPYTLILPMAGAGNRFRIKGFDTPKPLLPINNTPMVIKAIESLPPAQRNIVICLDEHINEYPIKDTLIKCIPNIEVCAIQAITEGQACTCEIGIKEYNISNDTPLLISACDNGAYYDTDAFMSMLDDPKVDVIVWSFTNNRTSKLYPHMYAWLDVDEEGYIHDVSIKKPFETKPNKHCIIGTMYFRKTAFFNEGLQSIYDTNSRTNGEFYVDNLLIPLIQKGYKLKVFEVKNYLCWGTPNDYKTYLYWDEYFRK